MKKIVLFSMLFNSLFIFSQNDPINRFFPSVSTSLYTNYKGNIKSLTIKTTQFYKGKEKIDTSTTILKYEFSKKGLLLKRSNIDKSGNIGQLIEYNNYGKITSISRRKNTTDNKLSIFAQQFFNRSREYPDSLNIYWDSPKENEKYINYFSNNLLVKQEHYTSDTLRTYNSYTYDNQNRLTKDNFYNTKNGFGITIGKSITGDKDEKTLYPNDSTLYSYKTNNDTLITIKTQSYPPKEITKEYDTKDYSLTITEQFNKKFLEKTTYLYTYKNKDSISEIKYDFNNQKEIRNFNKTFTTPKKIVRNWKYSDYYSGKEKNEIVIIFTKYDTHNNWIRKAYSSDNITYLKDGIYSIIERKIEYY